MSWAVEYVLPETVEQGESRPTRLLSRHEEGGARGIVGSTSISIERGAYQCLENKPGREYGSPQHSTHRARPHLEIVPAHRDWAGSPELPGRAARNVANMEPKLGPRPRRSDLPTPTYIPGWMLTRGGTCAATTLADGDGTRVPAQKTRHESTIPTYTVT